MSELDELILTCYRISDRLSRMADDERKFGSDLCYLLEQISYDQFKTAESIRGITERYV